MNLKSGKKSHANNTPRAVLLGDREDKDLG